jgi:DedD protein
MPQEEQSDDVKKRAIRRVAAAVVLALAAAGGLTMMSHGNKPAPQPQQTVLPAEPAAAPEQPASAVEPVAPEPQPASTVAETPPEITAAPTTKTPPPPPLVINNAPPPASEAPHKAVKPRAAQELVVTTKESVREALTKANITPVPAKPAEAKKAIEPQKAAEPAKSAKPAEKAPPPAPIQSIQAAVKGFAVQLGVFSNPANAIQMQEKLAQSNIKSYTETRLNVGPFQNKAEAEQALAKVRSLGINAVVVPLR